MEFIAVASDIGRPQAGETTYRIAEPGAKTWREARDMEFGAGRVVTANVYPDGYVSVFVGTSLHYDGPLPEGVVAGTPDFIDWARTVAVAGETGLPFMDCMPGQKYAHLRAPLRFEPRHYAGLSWGIWDRRPDDVTALLNGDWVRNLSEEVLLLTKDEAHADAAMLNQG
jgi:hypothetical protein